MNNYRFDLDKALAAWRRSLEFNRTFSHDDLDELEQHIRDEVVVLMNQGLSARDSFRQTMREMGDYDTAEKEYRKVYLGKLRRRGALIQEIFWRIVMWKNYLKNALRNARRHSGYTFINITGLAVGLTCCMLIFAFLQEEHLFDRFHQNADHIFRVISITNGSDGPLDVALSHTPVGPAMAQDFAEVRSAVRLFQYRGSRGELFSYGDLRFQESGIFFADSTFFDVFSFSLAKGNPSMALTRPNTVVLTQPMAEKYFGDADPIGQIIRMGTDGFPLEVTGVVEAVSARSHLQFNILISFSSMNASPGWSETANNWTRIWLYTYILLEEQADITQLEAKLPDFIAQYKPDQFAQYDRGEVPFPMALQPLTSIHFDHISGADLNYHPGDRTTVYVFSIIALFILLIACINFINLALALATQRAKEVGTRKVSGATRLQLVVQFLTEITLLCLAASLLGFSLAHFMLPAFNELADRSVTLGGLTDPMVWSLILGVALLVGVVAGLYPAYVLSSYRPADVLKGQLHPSSIGISLRKVLVVFQFSVSIFLLIGTGILSDQIGYLNDKDLGFDKNQVILIPIQNPDLRNRFETIKESLAQHPNVVDISGIQHPPGTGGWWKFIQTDADDDKGALWKTYHGDYDYMRLMGMQIVAGRGFSQSFGTDTTNAVLLNETAVRAMGWDNTSAIGQSIWADERESKVIGVVQDFHHESLHDPIGPLVLELNAGSATTIALRISSASVSETLVDIERMWKDWDTTYPFLYSFLDEDFALMYRDEERLQQLFSYFAVLAIFIACLGLFGIATYTARSRTKEIGIRKVFGASVTNIVSLLSKDFVRLVGIAFILAAPPTYYAMNRWLEDFAYRIEISWQVFLGAGVAALFIALLTVSYQSIKAALANPAKSLRYE